MAAGNPFRRMEEYPRSVHVLTFSLGNKLIHVI